jgi:SWI/SNF-related matrix-associated actin-dependent regulator 1 of chromatin subfamily A
MKTLYPHQRETVDFTINRFKTHKGVYNASDVGTGKTLSTIETWKALGSPLTLILCPAVVVHNFAREFREFAPSANIQITTKDNQTGDVLITSYDIFSRHYQKFPRVSLLVCDEAHYLKNYQAKRTQTVLTYIRLHDPYRIFLSGTPFVNSAVDAFVCFRSCDPKTFISFEQFANRYTNIHTIRLRNRMVTQYKGIRNADSLKELYKSFLIRFTKEDVIKTLPQLMHSTCYFPNTSNFNRAIVQQALDDFHNGRRDSTSVSTIRYESGLAKVKYATDYVKNMLEQGEPVILFAHHREVIKKLAEALHEYAPSVITGDTIDRQNQVDRFQNEQTNLIIMNIRAGGVGINLTRARHVIFAEFDWTYAAQSQAIGRAYRNGNSNAYVQAHYLLLEDSLDEVMYRAINFKEEMEKTLM